MKIRKLSDRMINKYFGHLEDHQYRHYNAALGCFVEGKEHFRKLMERGNYIPYDLACEYAEEYDRKHEPKRPTLSPKAQDIIRSVKLTADKDGNIKLGGRAIEALREIGAIPPKTVQEQIERLHKRDMVHSGGFDNSDSGSFTIQRSG